MFSLKAQDESELDNAATHKGGAMHDHNLKQAIFANPAVAIEISNSDGCITETNAAFRDILGYQESELAILKVADLCHNDDKERERQERRQLIEGELDHLTFRKRYRTKAGKTIWGDTNVIATRNAKGDCEAVVATMVDVTEQRRQELLQKGQTHILELLYQDRPLEDVCTAIVESIESVEEGLLCSILQLNTTTGTLHKIAAPSLPDFYNDAIEGMAIGDGVGSCGASAFFKRRVVVADILKHPYWEKARRLIEKTDLRSCWSQPIFSNNGEVLGTFAIYYTEPREPGPFELKLIRSAAELTALAICHKQALSALQRSDQLKSEFISSAAHELKTPLSSILGYAELLLNSQELAPTPPDKKEKYLNIIIEKTEMLSRIIDDLLDISKIEYGYALSLQKKPTHIRKTIANVINRFERNASQHVFSLEMNGDFPESATIDEGRIIQVLDNLLSNSVKYSPKGGVVKLVAAAKPDKLEISIIDHGVGMSENQLAQIFDKFYRANAKDKAVQGLGLGMSVVKEIIEAHKGDITIKSTLGEGTQVLFTVPHP